MRGEPIIVKQLLKKAKDSALLAVEFYNKPAVNFKSEGFITLMCIAWTSLFHAYFFKNKINPYYKKNENKKKARYETIPIKLSNGKTINEYKWWELTECLNKYYQSNTNHPLKKNLEFFCEIRNMIVHRNLPELDSNIYAECQANILNFNNFLKEHFGDKHSMDYLLSFTIQMFKGNKNFLEATNVELKKKNALEIVEFIKSFRSSLSSDVFESPEYAYKAVLIQVKNHESKDTLPLKFINYDALTDEQKEQLKDMMGVVLTKEKTIYKNEIPDNFSLTNADLSNSIKERYPHIKFNQEYNAIKKYLRTKYNKTFAYEWFNNPKSKKSHSITYYYDPKIIDEFGKIYSLNSESNRAIFKQVMQIIDQYLSAKKDNPAADTSDFEQQIDHLVYRLYDLTEEEIQIVEGEKIKNL